MRVHGNRDAPKRLGEFVLEAVASGDEVNVVYLALHELAEAGRGFLSAERVEQLLETSTRIPRSTVFYMPSGDLFMLAETYTAEALRQLTNLIAANLGDPVTGNDVSALCHIYEIPEDAIPLRKLIKAYLSDGPIPELPSTAAISAPDGDGADDGFKTNGRSEEWHRDDRAGAETGHSAAGPAEVRTPGDDRPHTHAHAHPQGSVAHGHIRQPAEGEAAHPQGQPVGSVPLPGQAQNGPLDQLEGPLTLDLLRKLQKRLDQIDLSPFIHQQPVYSREGSWHPCYVEHFFDVSRLSQTHFPSVDLHSNESLFVQLTRNLDDLMLVQILSERAARHGRIGINLTIGTVHSAAFSKITEHFSPEERRNIICELHWIEFLQDIQDGGRALQRLSETGYGIALDRISAMVLPYLQLSASWVDYIKVPFDRPAMGRIGPDVVAALKACDPRKLVLTSCDDDKAIALGDALGIRNFQGRLVDRMVNRAA